MATWTEFFFHFFFDGDDLGRATQYRGGASLTPLTLDWAFAAETSVRLRSVSTLLLQGVAGPGLQALTVICAPFNEARRQLKSRQSPLAPAFAKSSTRR